MVSARHHRVFIILIFGLTMQIFDFNNQMIALQEMKKAEIETTKVVTSTFTAATQNQPKLNQKREYIKTTTASLEKKNNNPLKNDYYKIDPDAKIYWH